MASIPEGQPPAAERLRMIMDALGVGGEGAMEGVRRMLAGLPAERIAQLLESSPPKVRRIAWELVDPEREGEVLPLLSDQLSSELVERMDTAEVAAIVEGMEADDVADLLHNLPDAVARQVLEAMDFQNRKRVERVLEFEDDTAGGMMNTDTITVRAGLTLDVVLRYLRYHENLPASLDSLFVVNRRDRFLGILPLQRIVLAEPNMTVREFMETDVQALPATLPVREVIDLFDRHDWVSAPVVDADGILLGRITVDDVLEKTRETADRSLFLRFGLGVGQEDTFAPALRALPGRMVWLGINLATAFIAAAVIRLFEDTLDKVVALAVMMPIVASMGGIAGSQTLTVVIRGTALGHISERNVGWLISRELLLGILNGLLYAAVVQVVAWLWMGDTKLGILLAIALVINLLAGAATGVALPIILRHLNIDPAVAASVILTTVTDVVGFFSFLGLATLAYG